MKDMSDVGAYAESLRHQSCLEFQRHDMVRCGRVRNGVDMARRKNLTVAIDESRVRPGAPGSLVI